MLNIKSQIELFLIALSFYSRLPTPRWVTFEHDKLRKSGRYFPLVGYLLAAIFLSAYWLLSILLIPSLALVATMSLLIWLTGAFHEDGFGDFCDGFGGGYSKSQILQIMKDSRLGSYGVIGLVMLLFTRYLALSQFVSFSDMAGVIVLAFSFSRFLAYSYTFDLSYVSDMTNAKAPFMLKKNQPYELFVAGLVGALPFVLFSAEQGLVTLVLLFMLRWLFARYLKNKIGGYTGDCLGAAQQVFELAIYLIIGASVWSSI